MMKVGTAPDRSLQARLVAVDGAHRLQLRPGWYYLGDGPALNIPVYDADGERIENDESDVTMGEALPQQHYLYGDEPALESWTVWHALPVSPGASDLLWVDDSLIALSLQNPPQSGTPVTVFVTRYAADTTLDDIPTLQLPSIILHETCPVQQRIDRSLVAYPSFAERGTLSVKSAFTDSGDSVETATNGTANFVQIVDTVGLGDTIQLVYTVSCTYATSVDGVVWISLDNLAADERYLIDVQYQPAATAAPEWRDVSVDLTPSTSGFSGGFVFLRETAPIPATLTFDNTPELGILYSVNDAVAAFRTLALTVTALGTDAPCSNRPVTWAYRTESEGGVHGAWTPLSAGNESSYMISPSTLDVLGRQTLLLSAGFFTGIAAESYTGLTFRAIVGTMVSTVTVPITEEIHHTPAYLQCVASKDTTEAGAPYRIGVWSEDVTGRAAIPSCTVILMLVRGDATSALSGVLELSSDWPRTAVWTDTQATLIAGDQIYAVAQSPGGYEGLMSNTVIIS